MVIYGFKQILTWEIYGIIDVNVLKQRVLKPTPHPKSTPTNASQSPTLYYLEPFPMEKECLGPKSDGFRRH